MSMKLDAGEIGRQDIFLISTENIFLPTRNGRAGEHDPSDVEEMAASILDVGQLQPAVGRRIAGNKVELVCGFRRFRAIEKINADGADPPRRLQVRVIDNINEESAFLRNLRENMDRTDLTAIDHAHNQAVLRSEYGWDEQRIATFYGRSRSWVKLVGKTGLLATPIQEEVRRGDLPLSTAAAVADLPEKKQKSILDAARDSNGHVNGSAVKAQVRASKQADGGKSARTIKEVRAFFVSLLGAKESAGMKELVAVMEAYISGSITDDQAEKRLRGIL